MNILISNDDGISSPGIRALAKAMTELGEVFVVAPETNKSAIGHAVTMHSALRSKRIEDLGDGIHAWWVNGTPADCVKLGIENIMKEKPDLLVSGINLGENLGTDVIYSGTVSAAVEGAIFGIPSIAFSYQDYDAKDYEIAAKIAKDLCVEIMKHGIPQNHVLNVNIPRVSEASEIKGIAVTKLGVKIYKNNFDEKKDPSGDIYYWLAGELIEVPEDRSTDIYAIKSKYVSITPINIDFTSYALIEELKDWELELSTK